MAVIDHYFPCNLLYSLLYNWIRLIIMINGISVKTEEEEKICVTTNTAVFGCSIWGLGAGKKYKMPGPH